MIVSNATRPSGFKQKVLQNIQAKRHGPFELKGIEIN